MHETLATRLINRCREKNLIIATAESCTGGLVSGAITDIAGSSDVFDRGFVTYSNDAKCEMLGVSPVSLGKFGAVSSVVAKEMAFGAMTRSRASLAVAVTGVAGPGASEAKPEGTVWFGVVSEGQAPVSFLKEYGPKGRIQVRHATVEDALQALLGLADNF